MKIADLFADRQVLALAGKEVEILLSHDQGLNRPENFALRAEIAELYRKLNNN